MGEEPFLNWNAPPIVLNDGAQPGRPAAADRGAAHAGQSWTCGWYSTAPPSATGSARAESRAANGRGRGREDRGADQGRAAADQQPQGRLSDRVDEKTTVMTVRKIPFLSQLAERPERTRRSQVHGAWRPKAAKERTRGR